MHTRSKDKRSRSGLIRDSSEEAHPKKRSRERGDIFRIRANNELTTVAIKVNADQISFLNPDAASLFPDILNKNLEQSVARPIIASPGGKNATTPGGTKMRSRITPGLANFFSRSNDTPIKGQSKRRRLDLGNASKENLEQSDAFNAIRTVSGPEKNQTFSIKEKDLKKLHQKQEANGHKRIINQAKAMTKPGANEKHASATKYAEALFNINTISQNSKNGLSCQLEWGHLIAHSLQGDQSQKCANLAAITKAANTCMMLIENQLSDIATAYPHGFMLSVTADLIPDTHIASNIHYKIKTDDFEFTLKFDALDETTPHFYFMDLMKIIVQSIQEATNEAKKNDSPNYSKI